MKNISVYLSPAINNVIRNKENKSQAIDDACATYDWLVRRYKPKMHYNEWILVFDSLNGTAGNTVEIAKGLAFSIADSVDLDGLDKKWGVEGAIVKNTINKMTMPQKIAVAEMARRFWSQNNHNLEIKDVVLKIVGKTGTIE